MSLPMLGARLLRRSNKAQAWWWRGAIMLALLCAAWQTRDFGWDVVWKSAPFLLKGLAASWALAVLAIALGSAIAVPLAAARAYGPAGVRHAAAGAIEIVRATPEIMVIFWAFFAAPLFVGSAVPAWLAAIGALTIIAAVYLAEVIRGGLNSVSSYQWEAALASGLNRFQAFAYVVLPQALRNMLPAFVAQLAMLFKATSLVSVVGVIEFFRAVTIVNNAAVAPYALYTLLAIVYFTCCWLLTWIIRRFDPRYLLVE
jgi:His/Glu/Gln/Arg/opine family amino acid ABC transporter permease subunit